MPYENPMVFCNQKISLTTQIFLDDHCFNTLILLIASSSWYRNK